MGKTNILTPVEGKKHLQTCTLTYLTIEEHHTAKDTIPNACYSDTCHIHLEGTILWWINILVLQPPIKV